MSGIGTTYICNACGWVYDPEQGDPDGGIAPGTPWDEIPDDWICPVCGMGKDDFEPVEAPSPSPISEGNSAGKEQRSPIVIVGSGLAGYSVAKALRKRDPSASVVMITADGGEAYSKPMLSNAFARHHQPDDLVQKTAVVVADELGIEIRTRTRVLSVDRRAHSLTVESSGGKATLVYDRLVLALGADPRVFPAEGSDTVAIFTVNDLDDYRRWTSRIGRQGRILLIGAGLIGCEFANDLATAGFDVSIVDPAPWPLARLLPKEIGGMLAGALETAGCEPHLGTTITRYESADSGMVATLDDGTQVPFDHVLSAVGLSPRTGLAKDAGLQVQAGILVDRLLRTSDPAIFALGDCAETEVGPLPFITPLLAQARALAATLSGDETRLQLPAMPVVVKTPALPLVVSPPQPGVEGAWEVELGDGDAVAVFRTPDGAEVGFALAGTKTGDQQAMAKRMPSLLSDTPVGESVPTSAQAGEVEVGESHECDICGYVYDPKEGDPDGGIPPGTRWEDIPDDWVCPTCGAGKDDFTPLN